MKQHINFVTIREDYNEYEVENGQVLRIKYILTDIFVDTNVKDNTQTQIVLKDYTYTFTIREIDTSNLEFSRSEDVTEKDHIKEAEFRPVRENINIYETKKAIILVALTMEKIHLTRKKDTSGLPILRNTTRVSITTFDKTKINPIKPL